MIARRTVLKLAIGGAAAVAAAGFTGPAFAKDPLALTGYDPVSYFSGRAPSKGSSEFTAKHRGLTYRFANAKNRDAFKANPTRYAPQFDGYCAFGVARGYKVGVDPLAFKVVSGKLYVNYSKSVQRTWNRDVPGFIKQANANWPGLK